MPQSLVQIYLHIVFSTKDRVPFIKDPVLKDQLHAYLVGACKGQDCPPLQVGGVSDHVHLLVKLGKNVDVSTLVREVKRESSKWMKGNSGRAGFRWQSGYGAFSISPSHIDAAVEYVRNQEAHHERESFQDEFRRLCKKYSLEINEQFVWD